ncbi:hypothetical protein A4W88_10135 (plasmid) [Latilactobacillus sakei]|nr:hypothetical protein A4W87_09780 [Latilactobacillus sakei]USG07043.1 hypothetical protein A4W88_10355 [Latilactobacillus sakei]USG07067.1 hypothetical protein A4W88_10135 [Latilactobacillus sakei]UTC10697.1 hypothetical protein A4W79_05415 [Latilactobacillus curvatus]
MYYIEQFVRNSIIGADSSNLIDTEEAIQVYMYDVFAQLMGQIFTNINQVIKEEKQREGWEKNGKRVSLKEPKAIMTTKKTAGF